MHIFRLISKTLRNANIIIKRNNSHVYTYTIISDVHSHKQPEDKILVKGWVKALRKQKTNVFVDVSDGSCSRRLQILLSPSKKPENLTVGSSVIVNGCLSKNPNDQLELIADNVTVIGECTIAEGYPFAPRKSYPPEYVRQYLHFRPRTKKFASLLRIRDAATKAIHEHFHSEGYFQIHTPILTSNDCESAGEVFVVEPENKQILKEMIRSNVTGDEGYFGNKAFLTVSGQLHLEVVAHELNKVYTFGPTFRAENSKSRLHLSEFYMVEAETAFVDTIDDIMQVIENFIKSVTESVLNKYDNDIRSLNESGEEENNLSWLNMPFVVLTYDEAISILENNSSKLLSRVNKEDGLTKEHEIFLVRYTGGALTFIIDWPKQIKPFYMKQYNDNLNKVAALDLLAPIVGEIVGGGLRENNFKLLKNKLPSANDLKWYLDLRKFGSVPTGGFGMGFERYLQLILGISNIKDTIPFPRWPHNCSL